MLYRFLLLGFASSLFLVSCSSVKKLASIVPATTSAAPDYFCTWNLQGYVTSYSSTETQRQAMNEDNIFGSGTYQNWSKMFKELHSDLYFLLDDSWDVPLNGDKNYFGSLVVDTARFTFVKGMSSEERLAAINKKIKDEGWKGLGLWICAQQAPAYKVSDSVGYWKDRLKWMNIAGVGYWKVDWGEKGNSPQWRSFLTELGKKEAPHLTIEHAMTPEVLSSADMYRTYDVENVIAIPHTIDRIAKLLSYLPQNKAVSVINCEDEPYIAVGLGCSIGVMRHEFQGSLPNGVQDFAFPPAGRDLKKRHDEVVRAVRWHRIALPFGINKTSIYIDSLQLHDYWVMGKNETWMTDRKEGFINAMSAPAVITRGVEKPVITLAKNDTIAPYILSSRYPNGAIAIASIGRTIERKYITPRADVLLKVDKLDQPVGIFGHYDRLTLQVKNLTPFKRILAQDLAGTVPVNITKKVSVNGNNIVIPGELIDEVGLSSATKGDKSEPGMVLILQQ